MSNIKLIGISGVTNGGKTSLSKKILTQFPSTVVINQDEFFRDETDPNHVWIELSNGIRHQNWETPESVNWDKLIAEVNVALNRLAETYSETVFLIIEGHLILAYQHFPFQFDLKFFLTLPKDICFERRLKRNYIPADPDGYFDEYIWPMYLKIKQNAINNHPTDLVFLDGTDDPQNLFRTVTNQIASKLF